MLPNTQINASNKYIVFDNFDVFYTIAKQIKGCHYYYLSKSDRIMYGCDKEGFALHAVDIPDNFHIPHSIYFDILLLNETIIKQFVSFVVYENLPWLMLPLETIDDHNNYKLFMKDKWIVYQDDHTVDFLTLFNPDDEEVTVRKIYNLVLAKCNIDPFLGEHYLFGNQEFQETIRSVFDNKASMGRQYLRLTNMQGKNYGMFIFKNLFNLNKADNLTIVIRDRLDIPNLFQATFITVKKKSPMPTIIPFYRESTYVMFLNIE